MDVISPINTRQSSPNRRIGSLKDIHRVWPSTRWFDCRSKNWAPYCAIDRRKCAQHRHETLCTCEVLGLNTTSVGHSCQNLLDYLNLFCLMRPQTMLSSKLSELSKLILTVLVLVPVGIAQQILIHQLQICHGINYTTE